MDDLSCQRRSPDLRSLMARNGCGLSEIEGLFTYNTNRLGSAEWQINGQNKYLEATELNH